MRNGTLKEIKNFFKYRRVTMIKLTMPDGSIREAEAGITALELVKSISNSLAKKVWL